MSAARPLRLVSDRVKALLAEVEQEGRTLAPEQLADAIGELEGVKSLFTIRLSALSARAGSEPDSLLTVEQAAERLGLAADTLYRKARSFPFTVRLPGRQVRFSAAGIDRFINSRQGR